MLKLRTILLYNYPYYLLLLLVLIISSIRLIVPKQSNYSNDSTTFTGVVTSYQSNDSYLKLTVKNKETIIVYYYFKERKPTFTLGETISVTGEFTKPKKNTTKYLFNYQKYLYNKNIHYIVTANKISKIKSTQNIYYLIKQFILNQTENSPYLKAFILGDKSLISSDVTTTYQENGISHLFAISGMHITLLSSIILTLLKKFHLREEKRYQITSILLIFYLSIIGLSPSALRGVLFFILFSINKIYYFYIKPQNIFIMVLSLTLLINPFFIYDVGFQYSFIISLTLILMSNLITGNYLLKLLKTSYFSFLVSIPISLYNYFQINILSIIYNLFYVPFVSIIIFPLSLVTIIFKPLVPIYNFLTNLLEVSSLYLAKIKFGQLIFPRVSVFIYLIYLIIIFIYFYFLRKKNHKILIILLLLMFFHYNYPSFTRTSYIQMIDVGQGDSILLHSNNENILIDTGGKLTFSDEEASNIVKKTTLPLLKSLGIRKLKTLILTHGDADHMGEAINLVENFKVEQVIFNCGEFNELEQELIKVLDKKKIPYYTCVEELNMNDNKLYFLNSGNYDNENDNSNVIYAAFDNYKFLFMGDAGVEVEKDLIKKYNLQNIDVLKIGHHGSKTSSSKTFINEINPKYSIISVGENNRYGHPNDNVLEALDNSKIYRTDQDGSVIFKIKNNKLKIETCAP